METSGGKSLAIGLLAYLKVLNGEKVRVEDWGNILATRNAQAIGAVLDKLGLRVCLARRESLFWFSREKGHHSHPHLTPIRPGTDEKVDVVGAAQFWDVMYTTHEEMDFLKMRDLYAPNGTRVFDDSYTYWDIIDEADAPWLMRHPLVRSTALKEMEEQKRKLLVSIYDFAVQLLERQRRGEVHCYSVQNERLYVDSSVEKGGIGGVCADTSKHPKSQLPDILIYRTRCGRPLKLWSFMKGENTILCWTRMEMTFQKLAGPLTASLAWATTQTHNRISVGLGIFIRSWRSNMALPSKMEVVSST